MLKLKHLGALLVAAAATATLTAQTMGQPEEFDAVAIVNNNLGSGVGRVIIRVERWSTTAEQTRLVAALKQGQDRLVEEMRDLRPVGTIRTPDSLGYDLRYAQLASTEEGGRSVVVATDRPISFWEARNQPRTIDYPFTFIQMEIDRGGEGKSTMSLFTKVIPRGDTIILENFASAPVMLTKIRARRSGASELLPVRRRFGVGAVAKQLVVGAVALAIDLLGGGAQSLEHFFHERERHLAFAGEHRVSAGAPQAGQVAQIRRPREHAYFRIRFTRRANHFLAVRHAGGGQDQVVGGLDAGFDKVSGRVASPYTASAPCSRISRTVSMLISITVGSMPFSFSILATVRPVGP